MAPTTPNPDHNDALEKLSSTSKHDEDASSSPLDIDNITPWQCIARNPKVLLWTLYANIGSTLVGYENLALSVCLAMPAFQAQFAVPVGDPAHLIIPAHWQSAWNAMYNVMTILGSFVAGAVQDAFGRRAVFLLAIIIASAGIAISYVSATPAHFLGGKITTGFAIGLILTGTQTWVSETAPMPMRGIALSCNTIMLNLGFLIAISSTFARVGIMDPSAFRVLFAAAWVFPFVLAVGLPFMPESPYYLVMKGEHEKARRALQRLSGEGVEARLVEIQKTVEAERALASEKPTFAECFRGTNLRRTRIILICFYMPQVVGAVLSANAPYFLNQTGLDSSTVIMLVQVGISMGVVSALANVFLMMRFRHRPLMFFGVGLCVVMYLIMGIGGVLEQNRTTLMVIGVALQFTSISYGPAVGASNAVAGEVSATRLRAKSLGIGSAFQAVAGTFWTIVMPYLFNQDQANLGGNIGWIFFGMGIIYLVLLYFDVPGTKGRSFEELDRMFEVGVSARKFEKFDDSLS
ncbi:general substrate transporter [Cercophora newfieldiana]|uniref:General substrate transporter n=1 Tax=Cercophora newfieldiana TaxID=92897 RepID=A0AA39YLS7_9PEZI|nr:general substrate transporter [Cercophora newfieldiana]